MTPVSVLLVDDNLGDVVLLREAMESVGLPYNLNVADNGVEAVDYLRRQGKYAGMIKPDLIILDLKLPRKTGMEVLDEIQPDPALRDIPIIILSSSTSELKIASARRDPPYTCIAKPNTFKGYVELAQAIEMFRKAQRKEECGSAEGV